MNETQEIKSRLDIVDVVSDHVQLRKSGRSYSGFCPFHPNTRTPAFHVFPETQTWHCFGACAEGGDIFTFMMKKEGWDFKEALSNLADRAGVKLQPRKPADKERQAAENKQIDLLSAAVDYFHQLFLHAPQAEHARKYVMQRQLTAETQETYQIGYALDSWDACRTHFNSQGYSDDELLAAGLLTENQEKRTKYDRFRDRLMIPIRDIESRVVGFGARTLAADGVPKYLNSPQTALFNKSHLLFGLDMAKRHIREARHVIIVEGYMDVMQAWQVGFHNVAAQMGTALTEQQLRLLKRYSKRFILALDSDAAGLKATMRGLQVARETLDRDFEVRFDARGLVRHEGRLQADIRIMTLPEGMDPDILIRDDPEKWTRLVASARPVVEYVIDVMTRDLDMEDAKAKASVARQVLPLIKDIAEPVERDHYWQQLAQALKVDQRALRRIRLPDARPRQPQLPSRPPEPEAPSLDSPSAAGTPTHGFHESSRRSIAFRQANYLAECLHHPELMMQVNQKLAANKQEIVKEGDFESPEDKALLRHMYRWTHDRTVVTIEELCDSLDDLLLDRVQSLLELPSTAEADRSRLADILVLSVLDWRLEKVKQLLSKVRNLLQDAQQAADDQSVAMYREQLQELPLTVRQINRARDAMSAIGRRRAQDAAYGR